MLSDSAHNDGYFDFTPQPCSSKIVVEAKKNISTSMDEQSNEWPFEKVSESLCVSLFK